MGPATSRMADNAARTARRPLFTDHFTSNIEAAMIRVHGEKRDAAIDGPAFLIPGEDRVRERGPQSAGNGVSEQVNPVHDAMAAFGLLAGHINRGSADSTLPPLNLNSSIVVPRIPSVTSAATSSLLSASCS